MKPAWSSRYWRSVLSVGCLRGFSPEWQPYRGAAEDMRLCLDAQIFCQESSSLEGRSLRLEPAFVAVCWPLGWAGPTACRLQAQSASPAPTVTLGCPLGTESSQDSAPAWHPTAALGCSALLYHVHLWGQPYQQPQMHGCFPSAHPSSPRALPAPQVSLTHLAEGQRSCWALSLWPLSAKCLGLTCWKPASTFQLYIPFPPTHDQHLEIVACLYFVTEMYKTALVPCLKIQQRENRIAQAAWEQPTFQPRWIYPCLKSPRQISETWVSILLQDFLLLGGAYKSLWRCKDMSQQIM